ncbi:MAG: MarR family winged helix-turn-helix transcriptional regulator [Chitinophagales bacterium]
MRLEEEINQAKFNSEFHKLSVNLYYTSSWLYAKHRQFFKKFAISPQQYNVLRILRGQYPKPATVNLLIDRMLDKMSNASRLVDKLEEKEYVVRSISEKDKRRADVTITNSGLQFLEMMDKEIVKLEAFLTTLNQSEATQLNYLMDKLRG